MAFILIMSAVDDLREPSDLLRSDDHNQFPVGLRVLAVDNDPQGLEHLTSLLRAQRYDELHTYWPYGADFIEIMEGSSD
ncbi:hypothetical protein Dimus_037545 [Dionaea muscipula]